MTWREQFEVYREKLEAISLRERAMVLLSVVAVVYLLAELLWLGPQSAALKQQQDRLDQLNKQLASNQQVMEQIQALAIDDPYAPKKREIAHLRRELAGIDQKLDALAVGLVSAHQLPEILENVLQQIGHIKLLKLDVLPVSSLELQTITSGDEENPDDENNELVDAEKTGVFKHSTAVVVEGSYFDILEYLQALEQSQWRFYWESLTYEVTQYPHARVEIHVYTLSTEEGLLGV